jgi:ABC-type Fe3+ transport system permease subunit
MNTWAKILLTPIIPVLFAYLELGGNWFGLRLLQRGPSLWSVAGTLIFSVLYSLTAAYISLKFGLNFALLMVAYGFGFRSCFKIRMTTDFLMENSSYRAIYNP